MEADSQQRGHDPISPATSTRRASTIIEEPGSETPKMAHDSLVTVRLSEPDALTLDTSVATIPEFGPVKKERDSPDATETSKETADTTGGATPRDSIASTLSPMTKQSLQDELGRRSESDRDDYSSDDDDPEEVNWEQLEKTEDEQTKDEETDNSTALLLARLEQENAKLATNPKSVKVRPVERIAASRPRPPSMAQLRQMVHGPTPPALRYSMLPPPPMTDLEFYAALVKDYQQTAARLPTLLSNKIRKGIPPPLRGVVWQSMSGARDASLEEQYERFCGETSPYELIIGKDLGRSFPGVDMFRDPEGDGQRMLGRVLKCFSLYDTKIGYCQGLAFLVGPLLMHMPDKQAFCVLVRLMERYDLRACFLPDLSGLHVRIYQFRELLRQNLPTLSDHLDDLQVDPAYVSQWFLSFFAVTCPLPMLFRIYDVIFAEGASETLMRVALSLMRKNEARLLTCPELEDVMQLLLSRGLWDCYHYNADEFVQDFAGLTSVVTREKLQQLEQGYRESQVATINTSRTSDITTAATRFLGRIWANSTSLSPKSATLSPGLTAPSRPLSMLRRSTSKQSLASTLNSIEASSASVVSSASTDATTVSRDSSNTEDGPHSRESTPVGPKMSVIGKTSDEKYLHSQIEDLLTALSELQRNHTILNNQLQREREDRQEDRKAVQTLLKGLKKKADGGSEPAQSQSNSDDDSETITSSHKEEKSADEESVHGERADDDADRATDDKEATPSDGSSRESLSELLNVVERRFQTDDEEQPESHAQSKSQMRRELELMKDQLTGAMSQSQEFSRRIHDLNQEMMTVKEQLRESHTHVRTLHQEKQRLERQIHGMRTRASASSAQEATREADPPGGLREFKLLRSKSTPSQGGASGGFGKRLSSLPRHDSGIPVVTTTAASPSSEQDALLLELVQAKTAQAMAKQEAEEAKQKLEALRKACGLGPGETPSTAAGSMGVFGRLTGQGAAPAAETIAKSTTPSTGSSSPSGGGGFWGWGRK